MSVSRDDFSIAFRSALLQRGATQKFSIFSLIVVALVVFFLDVYGFTAVKTARSFINDVVYRVTYLASAPTRLFPDINQGIANHFNLKKENEELRQVIERYKSLDLNLEYISNENKNLKKVLDTEDVTSVANVVLAKVLVDRNSPFLKSIIINKGSKEGIIKGMPVTQNKYLVGVEAKKVTRYTTSFRKLLTGLVNLTPYTSKKNMIKAKKIRERTENF